MSTNLQANFIGALVSDHMHPSTIAVLLLASSSSPSCLTGFVACPGLTDFVGLYKKLYGRTGYTLVAVQVILPQQHNCNIFLVMVSGV